MVMQTFQGEAYPTWLDGQAITSPLTTSRALHYGDGIFRTLLRYDNQFIDIKEHINKICHDMEALDLLPDVSTLHAQLDCAVHQPGDAVIKLIAMRRTSGRGYAPRSQAAQLLSQRCPLPHYPVACWEAGIACFVSDVRLAMQPRLAGIKHLNRLEQVLASRNWPEWAEEGLLRDQEDRPVCGTRSNLFWVSKGQLHTPQLSNCGVAGVMRDKILKLAVELEIATRIDCHAWQSLNQAKEVFVSNSLIGIWPVARIEQRHWHAPGPVTARLMHALAHPRLI